MAQPVLRPFQFLALPVEVRLRIYQNLFKDAKLYIRDGTIDLELCCGPLAICLTNHTIYNESIDELYRCVELTYEQLYRNVGPGDVALAPNCRRLIQTLRLIRKCHWTQFKLTWTILRSYTNLKLLILEDDSIFIYSNCDGDEDLHTDLPDIRDGVVNDALIDIIEDTLYEKDTQPLPMIKGQTFNAIKNRAFADPQRTFRIEYRKLGSLIDVNDSHIMMVSLLQDLASFFANFPLVCALRCGDKHGRRWVGRI